MFIFSLKKVQEIKYHESVQKRQVSDYPSKICYSKHVKQIGKEEMMTQAKTILIVKSIVFWSVQLTVPVYC